MIRRATLDVVFMLPDTIRKSVVMHFLEAVVDGNVDAHCEELAKLNPALIGYYKMLVDFNEECNDNYIAKCKKNKENSAKRFNKVTTDTDCIQTITTDTDCIQTESKYKGKDKGKCKDKDKECVINNAPAGTFANLVTIYTSDAHQLWHENLKRTYSLTDVELEECIRDGINYCINNGKALTESNIKRYTTIACRMVEHLAPMEQRDAEFKAECIALKDGSNDELVTEFYYYYRQPAKKDGNKMLFEMQVGWDTRTMFNLYLKRNGKY